MREAFHDFRSFLSSGPETVWMISSPKLFKESLTVVHPEKSESKKKIGNVALSFIEAYSRLNSQPS